MGRYEPALSAGLPGLKSGKSCWLTAGFAFASAVAEASGDMASLKRNPQIDAALRQPSLVTAAALAAAVGMEPRDIILTVNDAKVGSAQDTLTRIANAKPGTKVKITGLRGTEKFSSEVEVTERPRNR